MYYVTIIVLARFNMMIVKNCDLWTIETENKVDVCGIHDRGALYFIY